MQIFICLDIPVLAEEQLMEIKAGFVGFGEVNTPRKIIERKCHIAKNDLESIGIQVVYVDPVSDDKEGKEAERAYEKLAKEKFDFLVICIAGWIPSQTVINVASKFQNYPILLWGLAGYIENDRLVTTADQAGTTALRKVMKDMGYQFRYIYNFPGSPTNKKKIKDFARAVKAVSLLRHSKVGMMGFRDMNLYTTLFDGISLKAKFGLEVEFFEMLEIIQKVERLCSGDIDKWVDKIEDKWRFQKPARKETLKKGVQFFLAIRQKIVERNYQAISLIDVDGMKKLLNFPPAMILMLLTDEADVCTIPENDTLGAVTQLIVRYLTDQIAAYMEFYEFMEDRILVGVPDYVPSEIVDGSITVTTTGFGGFDEGILNVSKVKTGAVTLCRLSSKGEEYLMHVITGNAVAPRRWEEAGWKPPAPQLPSLEVILDVPIDDFAEKVLSQHYVLSYGDNTRRLNELCQLLNIKVL